MLVLSVHFISCNEHAGRPVYVITAALTLTKTTDMKGRENVGKDIGRSSDLTLTVQKTIACHRLPGSPDFSQ